MVTNECDRGWINVVTVVGVYLFLTMVCGDVIEARLTS